MGSVEAWSARLDAKGYHLTSIKRGDTAAKWNCEPTEPDDEGFRDGDCIIAYDPTNPEVALELRVGDVAYLTGTRKGQPAEIGMIVGFYAGTDRARTTTSGWRVDERRPPKA